jgi:hypothetical protein
VTLGEPEVGEALDLLHDVVGDIAGDAALGHPRVEPIAHRCHPRP